MLVYRPRGLTRERERDLGHGSPRGKFCKEKYPEKRVLPHLVRLTGLLTYDMRKALFIKSH